MRDRAHAVMLLDAITPRSPPAIEGRRCALGVDDIAGHPRLQPCIRQQALALLSLHAANPRIASVFATQQRWLIAHAGLAHYFRSAGPDPAAGCNLSGLIDAVAAHGIASRNTADAFLKEMHKYRYLQDAVPGHDRRARPVAPTTVTLQMISAWVATHLATLDGLDGGDRRDAFMARPASIALIQPLIADGLLRSAAIRAPAPTFSLFTWLNDGGIVMDWLIAGLAEVAPTSERIATSVASMADLGAKVKLSRTHLARKLRMAETMGSLGWLGERGRSTMWVSAGFVREYHAQQSAKLAIVESAFCSGVATGRA
jgi:hypothetical protein